jgi:hypothetical protein
VALSLLAMLMWLLKKLFPLKEEPPNNTTKVRS